MEGSLGLLTSDTGGGGGGSSSSNNNMEKTEPTISKVGMGSSSEGELELGLGLSLGCSGNNNNGKGKSRVAGWGERGRILTAQDFPCVISGTKRAAEEAGGSLTSASQVVGWPPIRTYRMNSLVNLAKAPRAEDEKSVNEKEKSKDAPENNIEIGSKISAAPSVREKGHLGFVKVNMDGHPIGRKVDLSAHSCYETLAQALEDMFLKPSRSINSINKVNQPSKLLDGSSEFVLTYEDKDGDWMLVGDVPWRMFLTAVRRLRIMRTSEANGLAPRCQDRNDRQRRKAI